MRPEPTIANPSSLDFMCRVPAAAFRHNIRCRRPVPIDIYRLNRCAEQVLDLDLQPLAHELGDAPAVAMGGVALVAQETDAATGTRQRHELVEFLLRRRRLQMLFVDAEQVVELAGARGEPALLRR